MGRRTIRSRGNIIAIPDDDFMDQRILSYEETCTFTDDYIEMLKSSKTFPIGTVFRDFDARIQLDFISFTWVCLPEYPFILGLSYPFSGIVSKKFETTNILYIQVMPTICRILYWIDHLNRSKGLSVDLNELAYVYDLTTFGNSRFLLKVKEDRLPLVLKSKRNDGAWKGKYFFIRRDSILDGNLLPQSWISRLKSWFLLLKTQRIGPKFFSTISESERSFKLIQSNFQESSFTTASMLKGSKSTRYGAHFTRDGLDTTMSNGHLTMKKEKTLPHIMRSHTILAVKTPGSKKRKNMRSIELSLENLGVEDALQKLASFSQAFSKRVSAELRARAERAEQVLKEQDKISRAIKKDLLKRVELLSK